MTTESLVTSEQITGILDDGMKNLLLCQTRQPWPQPLCTKPDQMEGGFQKDECRVKPLCLFCVSVSSLDFICVCECVCVGIHVCTWLTQLSSYCISTCPRWPQQGLWHCWTGNYHKQASYSGHGGEEAMPVSLQSLGSREPDTISPWPRSPLPSVRRTQRIASLCLPVRASLLQSRTQGEY